MKNIIDRYLSIVYAESGIIKSGVAKAGELEIGHELKFDGTYWRYCDLDPCSKSPSYWDGLTYMSRLRGELAAGGGVLEPESESGMKIMSALDYWLDNDFTNPNWWHNQIGIPGVLSDVCLILRPQLGGRRMGKALEIIGRGSLKSCKAIEHWTGANLIWGVWTSLRHALLTDDVPLLCKAVSLAARELRITDGDSEGIKRDGGFFQHGPQLYSGGYGRSFTNDIATIAYVLSESEYQFTPRELKIFCHHVLNGQRMLSCGDGFDFNVIGREISRSGAIGLRNSLLPAVKRMCATAEMPRHDELAAFAAEIENGVAGNVNNVNAVKYFDCLKYLVNKHPGFYIGVRGNSSDTIGGESLNGENALSYNLTYGGAMCMMTDGSEYTDTVPVWNYSMIPGTTAALENDDELRLHTGWSGKRGASGICGGIADGGLGAIYFDCEHDGITLKLTCVAHEGGMIVLANDVTFAGSDKPVRTTIEQSAAADPLYNGENLTGNVTVKPGESVSNGGFVYRRLDGGEMTAKVAVQSGSWQRNNMADSSELLTREVFSLYMDKDDVEGGAYAYSVEYKGAENAPEIGRVLNEKAVSAVEFDDGSAVVVLRENSSYTLPDGSILRGKGAFICAPAIDGQA